MEDSIVRKVWRNEFTDQLLVTIPKDNFDIIQAGDIVEIKLVKPKLVEGKCLKCKKLYAEHTVKELYDHKLIKRLI